MYRLYRRRHQTWINCITGGEPRIWTDSNIRASCGDLRGHHGPKNNDMLIDENQVSMHYGSSNCDSNQANISNSFEDVSNFIMFTKNARLSDEDRIAEVLIELTDVH